MHDELTVHTRSGPVDMVAVRRFLAGDDARLTPAERRVAIHLGTEAGLGPSTLADRLHENTKTVRRTLTTEPPPVDRDGRPFTLNP